MFDLDDTLHDAARASLPEINAAMTAYVQRELDLTREEADALRQRYWLRYGATLLGLARHHGVKAAHFLHDTHRLPGLEARVSGHRHDFAAIARLRGRKLVLTNAPRAYALRVLSALRIDALFDGVISIEDMAMFGQLRPKPDARMLRALCARLRVHPRRCVLVEDTLAHQKAARRVGMRTVWMRRYRRRDAVGSRRPPYVDRLVRALRRLHPISRASPRRQAGMPRRTTTPRPAAKRPWAPSRRHRSGGA
ncbi:MAG TPA: HAD-IA family hydrolase [Burkholderiaceae bacterium]|nr:HAD-IA family hydrolase [Burkholderiaceae bacterium]